MPYIKLLALFATLVAVASASPVTMEIPLINPSPAISGAFPAAHAETAVGNAGIALLSRGGEESQSTSLPWLFLLR